MNINISHFNLLVVDQIGPNPTFPDADVKFKSEGNG